MNKVDLKEQDIVVTRNKNIYWILYSRYHKQLCLYTYDLNIESKLSNYTDELMNESNHDLDIVGVCRGDTTFYNMARMREYEDRRTREPIMKTEDIFQFASKWKWIWKKKNIEIVTTDDFDNLLYYCDNIENVDAKNYYVTGREIKNVCHNLMGRDHVVYKNVTKAQLYAFIDHYIQSEFELANDSMYIMFIKRGKVLCQKVS